MRVHWWKAAFVVLCVVASSRWILADQWEAMGSTLRTGAWACGLAAYVAAVVAVAEKRRLPRMWSVVGLLAIGGGLLAAPELGAVLHGPASGALDRTIALCFVPVIVTVVAGIILWVDVMRTHGPGAINLRDVRAGLGPVEMRRVGRQDDRAARPIGCQGSLVEMLTLADIEDTGNHRVDPILRVLMRHQLHAAPRP